VFVSALALACAGFVALGMWQVQRLHWKEGLIARIEGHLKATPVDAPGPMQWASITRDDEYLRVRVRGHFLHEATTAVRASTVLGSGYWTLTPLKTDAGFIVLVNRGFVPPEMRAHQRQPTPGESKEQEVIGLLRFTEPGGGFLQSNDPSTDRWTSRDVTGIASARGLTGSPVAPYFIDAEANPGSHVEWPRAGLTVVKFSNNHLQYAVTWFVLAILSVAGIGYLLVDARRRRADGGEPDLDDPGD
jgi:surfeit locus 1 family protein